MELRIFLNGRYKTIKPDEAVKTTRAIHSFCCYNGLRDCLFKSQGGWYKLGLDGILTFVTPTLDRITFADLFTALKD